ncbi:MAG: hypothetical protein JWN43_1018 [Gammaproteobacteria bacterium]|nr:hypothetical protein [Gammaproteobacteria bacterium]
MKPITLTAAPPVFIAGPARSGTTLLRWILDSHPNIVCRSEQNFLRPLVAAFKNAFLEPPAGDTFAEAQLKKLHLHQDMRTDPPEIARRFRRLHESFYLDLCARAGKSRWADNTHTVLDFMIAAIDVMYDHTPHYLLATRHGLDGILSNVEKFGGDIRTKIEYWCGVVGLHTAFMEADPDRCLRVRYEELVSRPQEVCDGIFRFLGEEPIPDMAHRIFACDHGPRFGDHKIHGTGRVHTDSIGRWRSVSPLLYRAEVDHCPQFNALMVQLGYQPV